MSSHSFRDEVVDKFLELDDHRRTLPTKEEHREFFDGIDASSVLVREQVIEEQHETLQQLEVLFKGTYATDFDILQLETKVTKLEQELLHPLTASTRNSIDHQRLLLVMELESLRMRVQSVCNYIKSRLDDLIAEVPRNTIVETLRAKRQNKRKSIYNRNKFCS
eukprot:TRINITY_DN34551_c0_g1_i1.p1 TRINITY_DN34551_c0_g1~~TRINITY_DN34551_c0_g1_i1.p1  ORF type:complete len:164 (+),score=26.85 TRINITY_DN34551_c0_g1_i1:49-540(+)